MQNFIFRVECYRISKQARYEVYFSANDQLFNRIKTLLPKEQRKYNSDKFCWEITTRGLYSIMKVYKTSKKIMFDFGSDENRKIFVDQLRTIDAENAEKARQIVDLNKKKDWWIKIKADLEVNYEQHIKSVHKGLREGIKLFIHQVAGTAYLNEARSALISHEMGLGKTAISIAYVEMNEFEKVFVITPNSLKFNYYDEVEKFSHSKAHIIGWKKNKYTLEEAKYVIVNYDWFRNGGKKVNANGKKVLDPRILNKKFKELNLGEIDALICDESHKLKNNNSNTYKNFKRLFTKKVFRDGKVSKVFMSGTPMPNRAQELFTVLHNISPLDFATKRQFYEYYCGMSYDPAADGGWSKEPDTARLEELYHNIAPYTHRKKKIDCLDLPEKIYQKISLELDTKQRKLYNEIKSGAANEFINEESENPLTIMLRLRQYTASLKPKIIEDFIDRLMDEGKKVVVMDYFTESLDILYEKYKESSGLHVGKITVEDRNIIVKKFQDKNSGLNNFFGTIQTCNYGLTLTAANILFIITQPYSVGEYDQAVDRLHRIGQTETVNAYLLVFSDTIDEHVFYAIEGKRKDIVKVMDNEDYESKVTESVMSVVMEKTFGDNG